MFPRSERELEDIARRYDEMRRKMSLAQAGRPKSEPHRRAISSGLSRYWAQRKVEQVAQEASNGPA